MRSLIREVETGHTPLSLARGLADEPGVVLLQSLRVSSGDSRFSYLTCRPFLQLEVRGNRCRLRMPGHEGVLYAGPWRLLEELMLRYELLEEPDTPFPLGGVFGYWGYELGRRTRANDLDIPDLSLGFHDSLCVFDHALDKCWVVSTGMRFDGSPSAVRARERMDWWRARLEEHASAEACEWRTGECRSSLARGAFLERVRRSLRYIREGDIYQINLSRRLETPFEGDAFGFYRNLVAISPAPCAAWLDCGPVHIASVSPESFLKMTGRHVRTRPIKGTRPRDPDPVEDARLARELEESEKERAELVMITDLLRNDLGRVCEYGSISVPDPPVLESFPQVHHRVSTVEGLLREGASHVRALAACFPGGSVTGAPKIRAMQIIDELEPVDRGPYTGAIGFLGFNQISHLSIAIRTAVRTGDRLIYSTGAGIVADSDPEAEYRETEDKAGGFLQAAAELAVP